jgi:hypothetical protein
MMTGKEILALVRGLTDRELDVLIEVVRTRQRADEEEDELPDVTDRLSEVQLVALLNLLGFVDEVIHFGDGDEKNPAELNDIELSLLCFKEAWPTDDWNRRVDTASHWIYDEHGDLVRDPTWKAEEERQARLLEVFRPEPVGG